MKSTISYLSQLLENVHYYLVLHREESGIEVSFEDGGCQCDLDTPETGFGAGVGLGSLNFMPRMEVRYIHYERIRDTSGKFWGKIVAKKIWSTYLLRSRNRKHLRIEV